VVDGGELRTVDATTAAREVRAAATRNHGSDDAPQIRRGHERSRGPGARAKQAKRQIGDVRLRPDPDRGLKQTLREQWNVEDIAAVSRLIHRQQIQKKCREALGIQPVGNGNVARTEPARPAAMGEKDDASWIRRYA